MDFKISDTNKGKKSLIYDGFIYRIDGVLKCGDISWRCTNKKCKGRLRTDSAMSTMNVINLEYNLKMRSIDQAVTARKEDKTRTEFAISQYRNKCRIKNILL